MTTTSKLAGRQEIAEGTMAFHFEKPAGWTFEAGRQSISLCSWDRKRTQKEIRERSR